MTFTLATLDALEVLDSRSRPTISVTLSLSGGPMVEAGVPSGASTGSGEAVELRDGDLHRFAGLGVRTAVGNVTGEICDALVGRSFADLAELDAALIELDGTANKSRLGANAIVGVSIAAARASAQASGQPLWRALCPDGVTPRLPVPHFNVVNGGVHAPNDLDVQEFMIAPVGAASIAEAVRAGSEIYGALRRLLSEKGLATGLGDEGGFAPQIARPEDVLDYLVQAIEAAGRDGIAIAMDPASSEFYRDGRYHVAGEALSSEEMIARDEELIDRYPIRLLEDGLAESDWQGWERLTARLGEKVQLVRDDLLCTNPVTIAQAITRSAGNAALIKVNQVGTVTETLEAMRICREAGWAQFVSHRSGETDDTFIADLAVGSGCGQLKSGAPARGERVAKYNRLIKIEADEQLPFGL